MKRYAFDVVLLPSPAVSKKTSGLFGRLAHISLAMGVVREKQLDVMRTVLASVAHTTVPIDISVEYPELESIPTGETVATIKLRRTAQLQKIHEQIMTAIDPFASHDALLDDLSDVNAEPETLNWINKYKKSTSGQHFSPHITVSIGTILPKISIPNFTAVEIGLFHLGSYCTCPAEAELGRWKLGL